MASVDDGRGVVVAADPAGHGPALAVPATRQIGADGAGEAGEEAGRAQASAE